MTATASSLRTGPGGFRSSALRRAIRLLSGEARITLDPDGAVRGLESLREGRMLFGLEQLWFYKVQAGVVVHGQRPDWEVRLDPQRARLAGKVFDLEVVQSVEFLPGGTTGFQRKLKVRNPSQSPLTLRLVEMVDVTTAHFPDAAGTWGSLGVNAFNREGHVAMDEVSDPPSARVVGAYPAPARYFMTSSRLRAQEVISSGELPDATAGMSGQVLILSSHELELSPGEQREITFIAIHSSGKLEDALSSFGRLQEAKAQKSAGPEIWCSDGSTTEAAAWALSALQSGPYADPLDAYEILRSLAVLFPEGAARVYGRAKGGLRKDGSLPHSADQTKSGVLETALLLGALSRSLAFSQDKKLARSHYPTVKKMATFLRSLELGAHLDHSVPQGWRRRLGSGYPTGDIPEVDLAVAAALEGASQVARSLSKPDDAAKLLERSKLVLDHVRRKLLDERGYLALCKDSTGRLRSDDTVDMAVASYRHPFRDSAEQAAVHRVLERDFDTPFGPRTVSSSNATYFNPAYGQGQLGGVWTRGTMAHAVAAYRAGLPGVGSLGISKVARLVCDDALKLGGAPGEFPLWVDPDRREVHGESSDPVAAGRYLEAILEGELGLAAGGERPFLSPAQSSTLTWVMVLGFWAGETSSAFIGRGGGRAHLFFCGPKLEGKQGVRFAKYDRVDPPARGVGAVTFHSPGQVVCVGNGNPTPAKVTVNFPPKAADFSRHLSTPLEEYDPAKGSWSKVGTLRVSPAMAFESSLGPNDWKAYRVSTG